MKSCVLRGNEGAYDVVDALSNGPDVVDGVRNTWNGLGSLPNDSIAIQQEDRVLL